ncbi:MAG TPA: hypothetical protein VFR42_11905 [Candidatus Acidoferrum sp.]|nr:hypothetical protein [Candidatus Acidoferrum sp.]
MKTWTVTCAALILFGETVAASAPRSAEVPAQTASAGDLRKEIDAFNARFLEAHRKMDDAAILGMWAEEGMNLLPETAPMVGKAAITKFLTGVTGRLKGWRMEKMDLDFQGIETSGDWASESA